MSFHEAMSRYYTNMSLVELRLLRTDEGMRGVSYHSMLYLNLIRGTKDCTVSKLAAMLRISKPGVTAMIGELVKSRLIEKTQSEDDLRVFYLKITPEGERIYAKFSGLGKRIEKRLQKEYTAAEIRKFCKMLETVSACGIEVGASVVS
jgi:DNA-binding MarR family transcriptional regulator